MNCQRLFLTMFIATTFYWSAATFGGGHGCSTCCPRCKTCCDLKVEKDNLEKHCWETECKDICVPHIVFPWQKSCCNPCANNGAWVKTVKVLKKHTYECPTCSYTWTANEVCCGDGCCGAGCCGDGCCTSGCCDGTGAVLPDESGVQPAPADIDTPPAPPAPSAARPMLRLFPNTTSNDQRSSGRLSVLQTALRAWRE